MQKLEELSSSQPFYHALPDVNHPSFLSRFAATNGTGEPVAMCFCRVIGEGFMVLDREWGTPAQRWMALQAVQRATREKMLEHGVRRCVTWIPHEIEKSYGRRLESLGWEKQDRSSFVYEVA
jgi:hypothetical protein